MKSPALLLASVVALATLQGTSAAYLCSGPPTSTNQCGPRFNNARCMRAGDFCSSFGWCGSTPEHQATDQCGGPSPGFYRCRAAPRPDNRCGRDFGGAGCAKPFDFCSVYGWCGDTADHKATDQCGGPSPGTAYKCLGPPTETNECGPKFNNARCQRAGDFCSTYGWCGSSPAHQSLDQCGGPSPGFYTCKGLARPDDRCGRDFGGAGCSKVGDYCSNFGWCGNSPDHKASDQCGGPSPGGTNPSSVMQPQQPPEPQPQPRPPQPLPQPPPKGYKCLGVATVTGQCGPAFGNAKCMRSGDFCSRFGWCGSTPEHIAAEQCGGPSPGFYRCQAAPRPDNRCGRDFGGAGCAKPFDFCSVYGWCGNTTDHKATDQCGGPSPGGPNPGGFFNPNYKCKGAPTETGQCGPRFNNARCQRAGDFCSTFGWCGSSEAHKSSDQCGGPSPGFYTCTAAPRADNRCGSEFGNAGCAKPFDYCSKFGWCGNSPIHKDSDQCGGPSPGGANPAGAFL